MSGIDADPSTPDAVIAEVFSVLDRETAINSLGHLRECVSGSSNSVIGLNDTAVAFDSSVFLRLGSHKKSTDIIDYLGARHTAPFIVPSQTILEFWNNQLSVVDTIADSVRRKFEDLEKEVQKISGEFGEFSGRMNSMIEEFRNEYGYIFDEATKRNTEAVIDMLKKRGQVIEVPRERFGGLAALRQSTKTPPGFRDAGDGDFLVWVEFLAGLTQARQEGNTFSKAAFVTQDKKPDWSRGGQAHPILCAEVEQLAKCPFEVWDLARLAREVEQA